MKPDDSQDLILKILLIALSAIFWAFIGFGVWRGNLYYPEPKVLPGIKFVGENRQIKQGLVALRENTLIGLSSVYFPKTQVLGVLMERIAFCESSNRQYNSDGSVLRGRVNPNDIGLFQINTKYWLERSKELGYDIFSESGNIKMANYIFENYGTSPWNASKNCWNK